MRTWTSAYRVNPWRRYPKPRAVRCPGDPSAFPPRACFAAGLRGPGTARDSRRCVSPHASPTLPRNSTPSMLVIKSMRRGGKPIWTTFPLAVKSSTERLNASTGAPKASSACQTASALALVDSTHTSMSPVARGTPCAAIAWAPTTRNRAPASSSARSRSRKSGLIAPGPRRGSNRAHRGLAALVVGDWTTGRRPRVARERPHHLQALFGGGRGVERGNRLLTEAVLPDWPRCPRLSPFGSSHDGDGLMKETGPFYQAPSRRLTRVD